MTVDVSDPDLLGYLELSFVIMLNLSSFSALMVYRRLLTLFCQSSSILHVSTALLDGEARKGVRNMYMDLLGTVGAQLAALPASAFETELPDMDVFYLDTIASLRVNLMAAVGGWTDDEQSQVDTAWRDLQQTARGAWRWDIGPLTQASEIAEELEDEEEGEYAPTIVD